MGKREHLELAKEFSEALEANQEMMATHAAFSVTCEQFEIEEDEGYELLLLLDEED